MDYATRSELVKALSEEFTGQPCTADAESTRYDANTGTIYSKTGQYTLRDLEDAREKISEFAKKCTSLNSTVVLEPSFIRYANIIDTVILLCEMEIKAKQNAPDKHKG